jgi:hypothetical protein
MIRKISSLFGFGSQASTKASLCNDTVKPSSTSEFAHRLRVINCDPYLFVADTELRLISVFDDLKYDRSDIDILSGPMRRRVLAKLAPLGFQQVTGTVIENRAQNVRMHLPKSRPLGASPFDAARYTPRRERDFYVLTSTQAACQVIDHYPHMDAIERIKALIKRQPINLYRIMDFLEEKEAHQAFRGAVGHLKLVQREAVASEPLRSLRALR